MSGHTLKHRIDNLYARVGNYDVTLHIERPIITQVIEMARNEVFWGILPARENLFHSAPLTIANSDNVPDDWLGFIEGVETVTGSNWPANWIQVKKIPAVKQIGIEMGTAINPKLTIFDKKFKIFGTSALSLVYYKHPIQLYFDDPTAIDETVTDSIPTDMEPYVTLGAFDRLRKKHGSIGAKLQMTDVEIGAIEKARNDLAEDITKTLNSAYPY